MCRLSTIRRTVWQGAQELYEIQALGTDSTPIATMENDTLPLFATHPDIGSNDPNPRLGHVAYTHGPGVDQPLSITRINYRDWPFKSDGTLDSTHVWAPFTVVPLWNWRGEADLGTLGDGGRQQCLTSTRCVGVGWQLSAFEVERQQWSGTPPWHGTLIEGKSEGAMVVREGTSRLLKIR